MSPSHPAGSASTASARAVVGRLAPSPTGLLHLGHARTFLIAWWSARGQGGRVVLRIEDLDAERASQPWIDACQRDLEWLGLDWDGPAIVQSTGLRRIEAALDELGARGLVYPCVCSRAALQRALSAPQQGASDARYPGTCRGRFASLAAAERESGRAAALRFVVPAAPVLVDDALAGRRAFDVAAEAGDFIVGRKGGSPAYQLAVVVDDAAQSVTEVVRGDDLLPSAARQQLLQEALGLARPRWLHVPLVVDAAGRRLAKRAAALGLAELREQGVDARAIVAWVARSCGMDEVGKRERAADLVRAFSLAQVPREPVVVPAPELWWE